jgi:thiol-disulfide isomerase/thioredoxin
MTSPATLLSSRRALAASSLALALLGGCATATTATATPAPAPAPVAAAPAVEAAPAKAAAAPKAHAAWASEIQFVEDDWRGAMEKAKAEHKPLFVDSWATWCHTCLSMQRFVFPDAGLRPVKDAVIWLSVETEQEHAREFVEKYPAEGLPTFLLLDPDDGEVLSRWLGSGTVNEFRGFVQEGVALLASKKGGASLPEAARLARDGDAAVIKRDRAAAVAAYRASLAATPKNDPARPERLMKLVTTLPKVPGGAAECVQIGHTELAGMPDSAVGTDFAGTVAGCAEKVLDPKAEPKADPAQATAAKSLLKSAELRLTALTSDPAAPLSVDDRSDALATLSDLQESDGRKAAAIETMKKRAAILEAGAAAAPDAATASTFDAHRTDSYVYLNELAKAEQLLAGREKELPADYNPPARLARVLHLQKREAEALAAADRALALMTQGPRRVGILGLKAQILAALGKPVEPVLREQLAVLKALPATQRRPEAEAKLEAQLAGAVAKP